MDVLVLKPAPGFHGQMADLLGHAETRAFVERFGLEAELEVDERDTAALPKPDYADGYACTGRKAGAR